MLTENIDPKSYLASWIDLRRREAAAWLSFLLYLPGAGGIGWLLTKVTGSDLPAMLVAFVWMAMLVVNNTRLVRFRCPRCHEPFFLIAGPGYLSNQKGYLSATECVHCGLPKYALTKSGEPKLTDFEHGP